MLCVRIDEYGYTIPYYKYIPPFFSILSLQCDKVKSSHLVQAINTHQVAKMIDYN